MMARSIDLADFKTPPTIDGRQDFRRRSYKSLQHWYRALGNREYTNASVLMLGDSWLNGGFVASHAQKYSTLFNTALQRPFRPGAMPYMGTNEYLTPWVNSGMTAWEFNGVGYLAQISTTAGAGFSEITVTTDRFWILFGGGTALGTADVLVDGTVVGTINTNNATNKLFKFDSGAITWGKHVVRVRPQAGVKIMPTGGMFWNQDYGKGVQVWPVPHSGFSAFEFDSPTTQLDHWEIFKPEFAHPDLVIIELGGNDFLEARTPAQMSASLDSIVTKINTFAVPDPSICLMSIWSPAGDSHTDAEWIPYMEEMEALANKRGWHFFNLHDMYAWPGVVGEMAVADLVVTNGSAVVTSANEAYFRSGIDEGIGITLAGGTGPPTVPGGTTVSSIQSATQATLSNNVTASPSPQTVTGIFTNRKDPDLLSSDLTHLSPRGALWVADELGIQFGGINRIASIPEGIFNVEGEMIKASGADLAITVPGIKGLSADIVNSSSTVWSQITNFAFRVDANQTLKFFFWLIYTSAAAATGLVFRMNATAFSPVPIDFHACMQGPTSTTALSYAGTTSMTGTMTANGSGGATPVFAIVVGTIVNSTTPGLITPEFHSEVNASAVTLERGSSCLIL